MVVLLAGDLAGCASVQIGTNDRAFCRQTEAVQSLLQQALAINPDDARWWYQLGQMQFLNGNFAAAHTSFIQARDLDICPLRMTSPLEATLQTVGSREDIPFSNLHAQLKRESKSGILGDEWLVDHVHPGFDGHRRIGLHLAELLATQGWCNITVADWKPLAKSRFAEHASLDASYIHGGQRRLRNLRGWAAGKAEGPSAGLRFPHRSPSKIPPVSD